MGRGLSLCCIDMWSLCLLPSRGDGYGCTVSTGPMAWNPGRPGAERLSLWALSSPWPVRSGHEGRFLSVVDGPAGRGLWPQKGLDPRTATAMLVRPCPQGQGAPIWLPLV